MRRVLACLVAVGLLGWPAVAGSVGNCGAFRTWNTGDQLTAGDLNASFAQATLSNAVPRCLDDYSSTVTEMRTTADPYPSGAASQPTTFSGELDRLRYVVQHIFGFTQWYTHTDNVDLTNRSGTVQGAGYGAHLTAVGLHTWSGWRTGAPVPAQYPAITSVVDHWTGLAFPLAGHIAVVIGDPNVNGGAKGGIEMLRMHAVAITLHHSAAIMFRHSGAAMDGGQRGHVTALSIDRGLVSGAGRDDLILGHAGAGLQMAANHVLVSHIGGYIQLVRHTTAAGSWRPAPNALYADTLVKAVVDFDGSLAARPVQFTFNVASVTRNSVGDYSITYAVPMLSSHYAVGGWVTATGVTIHMDGPPSTTNNTMVSTGLRFQSFTGGGALTDCVRCTVIVVGPQ